MAAGLYCGCGCAGRAEARNATYDQWYAAVMANGMQQYEKEIAPVKRRLFGRLSDSDQDILELGIGTGPNLQYYAASGKDRRITGVDPNGAMESYAQKAAASAGLPPGALQVVPGEAERIPLPDSSFDVVICTLVLCSVADPEQAVQEIKRVLRPGGQLLFIEHVLAPQSQKLLQVGQRLLSPVQQLLADGCHLDRNTLQLLRSSELGGEMEVDSFALEVFPLVSPHIAGSIRKA